MWTSCETEVCCDVALNKTKSFVNILNRVKAYFLLMLYKPKKERYKIQYLFKTFILGHF